MASLVLLVILGAHSISSMEALSGSQRILFARHGETDYNAEGRIQGCLESRLTFQGLEQAAILGNYIAKESIDQVYCSPMIRARQTLAVINGSCIAMQNALPKAMIHNDLREIELFEWQGMLKSELEQTEAWKKWRREPENLELGNQNFPVRDLWQRAVENWKVIRDTEDTTLVIAHGALGRCMLASALGYQIEAFRDPQFSLDNCELVELLWSPHASTAHSFRRLSTRPVV